MQGLGEVQAIGEHQGLALRVDAEFLVVGDGLVGPEQRVPGVVARAVEQLGEVQVAVLEKGVHADAVGQGDAE
ncbi:hypothetical protein D9M71_713340 [compost metagenome]